MTYKHLGDYIREVNVRNRDEKVTKLVGLTIPVAMFGWVGWAIIVCQISKLAN